MSHQFIKNRDIVIFSFQSWNSDISFNIKDIAFELSRYNRVLFIDRARDRNTVLREFLFRKQSPVHPKQLEEIQENFWVFHPKSILESGNWSPNYKLFDFFNQINNRRLAREIKNTIRLLGFNNSLLINDNDFFRGLYMKSFLPVREYIFYIRDFLTGQPFFKKFGTQCEIEMIRKSDLVVTNSAYLAEHAGQWNPNTVDIGQGFNIDEFPLDELPEPEDLKSLPRPIIGYLGAITAMRLDEDLLLNIASSLPWMSLVMVGPVDSQFQKSRLRSFKNVFFLGTKKPGQAASYMQHFTVCINPQLVNSLTVGNYPRKLDEYLAMGKPVVATNTQAMDIFREHVFLAESASEFIEYLRELVVSSPDADALKIKRRQFALTHTWERSVGALGDAFFS